MATLLARQLRHHVALLAAVMLALAAFELFMVWVTSSMQLGPEFESLLQMLLPPAMLKFVLSQFAFASPGAAVAFGFEHPLVIISGIGILIAVASIPAAERETGLLDVILARPLTRERYLAAHMLLLGCAALLIPLALLSGAAAGIALAGGAAPWHAYIGAAAAFAPLLLLVGAATLWFAAGARRRGTAVAAAAAVMFLFFAYDVLAAMWGRLDGYEWATIFHYYEPVAVFTGERGARESLILLGAAAVLLVAALVRFRRQRL